MINANTEIRFLPSAIIFGLTNILQNSDSWKRLMSIIPSDNGSLYPFKYNVDHIRLIELETPINKTCSEVLLDEWGTSGRIRPTVGFLMELLVKANLYRAADYVSMQILQESPIDRPCDGPAASVDTILPSMEAISQDIEQCLQQLHYPSSSLEDNLYLSDKVLMKQIPYSQKVEKIEQLDLINLESAVNSDTSNKLSDLHSSISNSPDLNALLSTRMINISSSRVSRIQKSDILSRTVSDEKTASEYLPNFQELDFENEITQESTSSNNLCSGVLPNLSTLFANNSNEICSCSEINSQQSTTISNNVACESYEIPNITELISNTNNYEKTSGTALKRPIINADIPHVCYSDLKIQTNKFNEKPFGTSDGCKLGSGAFGIVYWAKCIFNEVAAVKKLHSIDSYNIRQFQNEVEIICRYKHKNLLRLLGYSSDGPTFCLIYEYMPGGSLQDRLRDNANILGSKTRLDIAIGCAEALDYLHTSNVPLIHRDVKSANVLLDFMDVPKLSDFGLIKLAESSSSTMQATTILGTSAYMSPEAHNGEISIKMDCYSFGVVILELVTGLPPLDEDTDLVTRIEQLQDNGIEGIDNLIDGRLQQWATLAKGLYKIATDCLLEERQRPLMRDILEDLQKL